MAVNRHFLSSRSILSIEHSMPCSATALRTSPYATAGKDGRGGERGPKGERGERGLIGPKGDPAPTITGWRVDCAAYTAVPLLSNGSEGAPLELRDLFKQFFDELAPHR